MVRSRTPTSPWPSTRQGLNVIPGSPILITTYFPTLPSPMPTPLTIAQVSDPHLFADPEGTLLDWPTRASFAAVLDHVRTTAPDLVLLTGDLTHDAKPATYQAVSDLMVPLDVPCLALPGNHDDPALMQTLLHGPVDATTAVTSMGGWHLVLLDSHVSDATHGRLSAEALDTLDTALRRLDGPTLLAVHHPPMPVGAAWLDAILLHNPDPLEDCLRVHPQVRLLLCGHVHQAHEADFAHARLYTCPSTCIQFKAGSKAFALADRSPGYRTFTLHPDGRHEQSLHRVPVPFQGDPAATGYT